MWESIALFRCIFGKSHRVLLLFPPLPHVSLISRPIWHLLPVPPPSSPGDLWFLPGQKERREDTGASFSKTGGGRKYGKSGVAQKKQDFVIIHHQFGRDRPYLSPFHFVHGPREKGFAEKNNNSHIPRFPAPFSRGALNYMRNLAASLFALRFHPSLWNDFSALISTFLWCMEKQGLLPPSSQLRRRFLSKLYNGNCRISYFSSSVSVSSSSSICLLLPPPPPLLPFLPPNATPEGGGRRRKAKNPFLSPPSLLREDSKGFEP